MNIFDRSLLKIENGLPYFEIPEITQLEWIRHGFLTRKGGSSPPPYDTLNLSEDNGDRDEYVSGNKNLIAKTFGFDMNRLILLHQVHQDQIMLVKGPALSLPSPLAYDAQITNASNIFLGILTADCVPIFVADQKKKAIAAIHAGRQGTALHITTKVLQKMKKEFGCLPEDLLIALGPSIGFCCYEIDEKVFSPEWEPFSIPVGDGKWMLDLVRINIAQIEKEGIKEEQIFWIDLCTSCHRDLFFSNRKEGKTGRQLSFIGIKE
jgi:YfiH family protein